MQTQYQVQLRASRQLLVSFMDLNLTVDTRIVGTSELSKVMVETSLRHLPVMSFTLVTCMKGREWFEENWKLG